MSTTVRELIEKLQTFNPDFIVGVSSDSEGNSTYEFGEVTLALFDPEEGWGDQFSGYIYQETETEDGDWDEEEVEVTAETANAVVIWP